MFRVKTYEDQACLRSSSAGKRPFEVVVHNVTCSTFDSLAPLVLCDVNKLATSRYSINIWFKLSRTVPAHIIVRGIIDVGGFGRKTVRFFDIKINVCDLLHWSSSSVFLVRQVMDIIRRNGNLPLSCPIEADKMYNLTNLVITDELFPMYTPAIHLNVTVNFYDKEKLLVTYLLRGYTIPRNKRKF
ncbi:uncharacterized protein LOC131996958 [Stomoxys calcitrans]|uniref:uncharacterized protein LOC131996958 n=1 Tax=Stomoxys calcitrans TaxID=35570 RepID=UPI0027E387E3|nr:uncharacterized protein LOC131996958 [Stomoxys calcitrans]